MTALLVGVVFFSLFVMICFKNFCIQIISIKLLLDSMVLVLVASRGFSQNPFNTQVSAGIVAGSGLLIFFILMASAIQMFSKSEKIGLKVEHD